MPGLFLRLCLVLLIALSVPLPARAETVWPSPDICQQIATSRDSGDLRVAVVVGNGAYGHGLPALPNPAHDAGAVARALSGLGFEVFLITDAPEGRMGDCLAKAYQRMSNAAVGLFYYSGHGIQIDDENYLVATDARAGDLKTGFVPIQAIVDEIQRRAAATLIFLDACRDNPLARNGQQGLSVSTGRSIRVVADTAPAPRPAQPQAHGLMVAYSTSPNAVALDGNGELSPFTDAFVHKVATPGYSIQRVMSEVTNAVGQQTMWAQTPWMKSSLTGELKLAGAQTLEEAQAISQNWANSALKLLWTGEGREAALTAALKGLPAHPSQATLKLFPQAYLAVYSAMQTDMSKLPVNGMPYGDISSGDLVAVLHRLDGGGSRLELWSRARKVFLRSLAEYPPNVAYFAKFSPDGAHMVSFGEDRIAGWDVVTGTRLFETVVAHDPVGGLLGQKKFIFAVDFSSDGKFLYIAASDKKIVQILDASTGRLVQFLESDDFPGIPDVSQAPLLGNINGNRLCLLLTSKQQAVMPAIGTYDLASRQFHLVVHASSRAVMHFDCDPAGRYAGLTLLSVGGQSDFVVWDIRSGKKVLSVRGPVMDASFDPHGRFVLASMGNYSKAYDLSTGMETHLPTIPDDFRATPGGVSTSMGIGSLTMSPRPWFSWALPDGPALVDMAMSTLSAAGQAAVARDRIGFAPTD